jgi:hypothetical protein
MFLTAIQRKRFKHNCQIKNLKALTGWKSTESGSNGIDSTTRSVADPLRTET